MNEIFLDSANEKNIWEIYKLISPNFWEWVKERSLEYLEKNIENFFVLKSNWKILWCLEKIFYTENFLEVWCFVVSKDFSGLNLWEKMLEKFLEYDFEENIFLVSDKEKLIKILLKNWFSENFPEILESRKKESPKKKIFVKIKN